ncbi:Os01g0835083, partial [Oryza sativa Japonica Group]
SGVSNLCSLSLLGVSTLCSPSCGESPCFSSSFLGVSTICSVLLLRLPFVDSSEIYLVLVTPAKGKRSKQTYSSRLKLL